MPELEAVETLLGTVMAVYNSTSVGAIAPDSQPDIMSADGWGEAHGANQGKADVALTGFAPLHAWGKTEGCFRADGCPRINTTPADLLHNHAQPHPSDESLTPTKTIQTSPEERQSPVRRSNGSSKAPTGLRGITGIRSITDSPAPRGAPVPPVVPGLFNKRAFSSFHNPQLTTTYNEWIDAKGAAVASDVSGGRSVSRFLPLVGKSNFLYYDPNPAGIGKPWNILIHSSIQIINHLPVGRESPGSSY